MTWAKIATEYADELAMAGLSDAAFRTHTEAILFLYRIESADMRIPKHLLRRFAGTDWPEAGAKELAEVGLWREAGDAWVVVHHAATIRGSIGAQRAKRERDVRAQRRHRKKSALT